MMHVLYFTLSFLIAEFFSSFTFIDKKKKKKEWYPLVILNSDFALFNHRQITLLKYLWQITQEFLFLPS